MKTFLKIILILGLSIGLLWGIKKIIPILSLDGYSSLAWHLLFPIEDTEYSDSYSHKKFLKIKKGMTEKEVIDILGEPLAIFPPTIDIKAFQYSESPSSTHYRLRQVYFKDGIVSERVSYYYID